MAEDNVAFYVEGEIERYLVRWGRRQQMDAATALRAFKKLNTPAKPFKIYKGTWDANSVLLCDGQPISEAELRQAAQTPD